MANAAWNWGHENKFSNSAKKKVSIKQTRDDVL